MALVSTGLREQLQLIHWEQFMASDNPVRVIDAFVDLLDLEQLGFMIKGNPFGTIKRGWGFHYTLLKRKEKVAAEMAIIFSCYNLRRSMSIFGVSELLQRLKAAGPHFLTLKRDFLSLLGCYLFSNIQNKQAFLSNT